MRGDGGVAGEGRIVGVTVTKFHSWGTCTMPLTQIGCPMLSQASDNSSLFSLNCWGSGFGLLQFAIYLVPFQLIFKVCNLEFTFLATSCTVLVGAPHYLTTKIWSQASERKCHFSLAEERCEFN